MNHCYAMGWVVGIRALPVDPRDHDTPGLPIHGCNHLVCQNCNSPVSSTAAAGARVRTYKCGCVQHLEVRAESIQHQYAYDEEIHDWRSAWACGGHPLTELPHTFDGVLVTEENLEVLVDAVMSGTGPELRDPVDADPGLWASRLAKRLAGTPHPERIASAAGRHLTSADVATRARAVHFFADTGFVPPSPASLLGEHAALFVGVANPRRQALRETLERTLWDACRHALRSDAELREVAHAVALDPARASKMLFFVLADHDRPWMAENRDALLETHEGERWKDLVGVLSARGLCTPQQANEVRARKNRPRPTLAGVLTEARALVARPDNDFTWSSWIDTEHAVDELDRHLASIAKGEIPWLSLNTIFAPTGPMQELAIASGWGGEFNRLAEQFDEVSAAIQRGTSSGNPPR